MKLENIMPVYKVTEDSMRNYENNVCNDIKNSKIKIHDITEDTDLLGKRYMKSLLNWGRVRIETGFFDKFSNAFDEEGIYEVRNQHYTSFSGIYAMYFDRNGRKRIIKYFWD